MNREEGNFGGKKQDTGNMNEVENEKQGMGSRWEGVGEFNTDKWTRPQKSYDFIFT